jgi:hypothetical protein
MSAVLDAIRENLRKISIVFEPTESSFLPDKKNTGDARELTVKEFLESFFPPTYRVRKGLIYSREGRSQEIDCILLAPNHPPLVTPVREVTIAEGVYAAIEVKPDISTLTLKSEFHRGLVQIQSVKRLSRTVAYLPTNDVPAENRIPSVIFASKSRPALDLVNYMVGCVNSGDFRAHELPDLVVTLDNGLLFHTASMSTSMLRAFLKRQKPDHGERAFLHFGPEHNTLALFLLLLYSFTPPEPHLAEPVLKPYLGFQADTSTIYEY